ncbi:MAG: DUF1573 domain-containing protein [bacterium]
MSRENASTYAILVTICILASFSAAMAQPQIYVPESSFNFGYAGPNAKVSHVFWLKSIGDTELQILKVTPGCGCTEAPLGRDKIEPGDSTHLEIVFSTGKYRNNTTKRTRLQTNSPTEFYNLRIEAYILPQGDSAFPLHLPSFEVDLTPLTEKPRLVAPLTLTNLSSENISIQLTDTYADLFRVELPTIIEAGQTAGGAVYLTDLGTKSIFEKSFTFEADNISRSRYTLSVKRLAKPGEAVDSPRN